MSRNRFVYLSILRAVLYVFVLCVFSGTLWAEEEKNDATQEYEVRDIHLTATETLELPPEVAEHALSVSGKYQKTVADVVEKRARLEFLTKENAFLAEAGAEKGSYARFLTQLRGVNDADVGEYAPVLMQVLQDGTAPAVETLSGIRSGLETETEKARDTWKEVHDTLVQREFLLFDLESNRHIVTQLASMFSMDKRWFWLLGVIAFGALVFAVWHERRHEIRRWLNGGRARQMKLAQVLTICFTLMVAMTLISFLMGETIYRAMLDMTFSTSAPQAVYAQLEKEMKTEIQGLDAKISDALAEQKKMQNAWKDAAGMELDDTEGFMESWKVWRAEVCEIAVLSLIAQEMDKQIRADSEKLQEVDGRMGGLSGDTLFFLRVKHLVRFLLGMFLGIATFMGIACFWAEVHARLNRTCNICPHCLSVNTLQPCDDNGIQMPAGSKSRQVLCTKVVQETPYEICGYRFENIYRSLTKLSFPTLGIPQVGKTHWLTMLYWEIQNRYYPKLGFSCVPSSVTEEMDRRVEEIMNYRIGTAATQRDSIPLPLMLRYRDKDPLGQSEIMANIFDYSGEITTDAASDDYRRERALKSEGFLFFLDPTFPWQPQAEALKRFRRDLKSIKGLRGKESLHLPIAVCLTKIDLLPLVKALGNDAEMEAIRFYEELGRIDPTGTAMNRNVFDQRSILTDELRKKIWPDWDMEAQINDLFGGRYKFFPLSPVGLDGVGEADLRLRTIAPFGLVEPLVWLLEMSGYPTLTKK
ncbi:MAG: hypothetical protein Q4C70_10485 [Planctomycetia bacterium]|nr:hypothetical protein [Planctomycetia bacterium]